MIQSISMRYTILPEGDKIIQQDIDKIKEVLSKTKIAAYLFGSYGRGEGALINGKPTNDYDLYLNSFKPKIVQKLQDLQLATFLEVHTGYITNPADMQSTQQLYEMRYGSHLLNGKAIAFPDWQPYEIPFADAANSLNRRAVSLIIGKYELMKDEPNLRKVSEQLAKGIIALGDATLIKRGEFHHLYSIRSLMLQSDEIGKLYSLMTSIKLLDEPKLNPDELWQLWVETRHRYRQYIVENALKLPNVEFLLAITERHNKATIKQLLEQLGVADWIGDDTK